MAARRDPSDPWNQSGNTATLPAWGGVGTPSPVVLLAGSQACDDRYRVVDILSVTGRSFEVDLEWAGGGTAQQQVSLTVPRQTRVCLQASWLKMTARNLAPADNQVWASIANGQLTTANYCEVRGSAAVGVTESVPVPRWAKTWRFETVGAAALGATLRLLDEQGLVRVEMLGTAQPSSGSPVGNASFLQIVPAANALYRVIFDLFL